MVIAAEDSLLKICVELVVYRKQENDQLVRCILSKTFLHALSISIRVGFFILIAL